jgi:hypothetical protein
MGLLTNNPIVGGSQDRRLWRPRPSAKRYFTSAILGATLLACTNCQSETGGAGPAASAIAIVPVGPEQFRSGDTLGHYLTSVSYLRLSLPPGLLMGVVAKIVPTTQAIYVLDKTNAKRVFAFTPAGAFLRTYGEPGQGPGQLSRPVDFLVEPGKNRLLLLDVDTGKVLLFDLGTGQYQGQVELDFPAFALGQHAAGYAFQGGSREDRLIVTDGDFKRVASYFPYNGRNGGSLPLHFTSPQRGQLLYRTVANDSVFDVSSGSPKPYLVVNFGKYAFGQKNFEELPEAKRQNYAKHAEEFMVGLAHFQETATQRCFAFRYRGQFYYAFGPKGGQQASVVLANTKTVNDVSFEKYFPAPVSDAQDGFLYATISPEAKDEILASIAQMPRSANGQQLAALLQAVGPASGPILVKYQLAPLANDQ